MNVALMKKEVPAADKIPYRVQISDHTVMTEAGEYMQFIRFTGAAFESADDEDINHWHRRLNILYRTIGTPNIMLYQHTVRRPERTYPESVFEHGSFAEDMDKAYQARLGEDTLWVNELYLTVVYKPPSSMLTKALIDTAVKLKPKENKLHAKVGLKICNMLGVSTSNLEEALKEEEEQAEDFLAKIVQTILASLDRYDPELLGVYEHAYKDKETGVEYSYLCSRPLEFLAYLINGEWQRMPLPDGPINEYLTTNRLHFGTELFQIWNPEGKAFTGAVLSIKEPNSQTYPGCLNQLLRLPFPFVLVHSFAFQFKETSKNRIKLHRNRLITTNDEGISQQEKLDEALDDITSGEYLFGDYHFSLLVYGKDADDVHENVSIARSALADAGMVVTREDAANEAAFWAQLPGNTQDRPRVITVNTLNFAGLSPFHNFPQGRKENNYWGPALTVFKTSSQTPLFFSLHASDPQDPDGGSRKDVAHTLILGPTGCGKTAWVNFIKCELKKFGVTQIALTKDCDSQICIQACGGLFFPLLPGLATGFNPFDVADTPENRAFAMQLTKALLRHPSRDFLPSEEDELALALKSLWGMPQEARRLRYLRQALSPTTDDGLHMRLRKWIEGGEYAWIFDNETDTLHSAISGQNEIGFDITHFLDIPEIRTPINMYLFHQVNRLMDGRRLGLYISEFWKALDDPAMEYFTKDGLKTQRKKEAFTVLDSQSPSDALNSSISRTLIEQTATKILFPNPDASEAEYIDGLNCTEREVRIVKDLDPGSRQFLVKQGKYSVVAELNLKNMHYHLAVLSTRQANIEIVNALREQFGVEPGKWLPMFREHIEQSKARRS